MRSLLVIGRDLGEVAARVMLGGGGGWEVHYPCDSPAAFAAILAAQPDGSIERLDVCDHGGPGFLMLGDAPLFHSDRDPESPLGNMELAIGMRRKLTATAQVRLLGCDTAGRWGRRREGRLLLLKLARLLNEQTEPRAHRLVFGTITGVQASDFDEQGLLYTSALTLLFSSNSALDHDAPTYESRLDRVAVLHGDAPVDYGQPVPRPRRPGLRPAACLAALRKLVAGLRAAPAERDPAASY